MPTLTFSTSQESAWTGHSHSATWTLNNNNGYATLRSLSTACIITQVYAEVTSHTDTIASSFFGVSLPTCSYSVTGNSQTLISGSFDIPKKNNNSDAGNHSKTQNVSYTGANFFGSKMTDGTFKLSYSASGCDGAYHSQVGASTLKITYSERCYVTFMDDGSVVKAATIYDSGHTLSGNEIPSVSKTGYIFTGWKSSLDNKTYTTLPACTGTDVTYTAVFEPEYTITVNAQNTDGESLTTPSGLTPGGKKYLGDAISFTAPSGDYIVDANTTYVFVCWQSVNEDGTTDTNNANTWSLTQSLTATQASNIFGNGTTLTVTALYQRAYDVSLSLLGANQIIDPTGIGHLGLDTLYVYDSWGSSPNLLDSFGHDDLFGDDGWVNTGSAQIRVDIELTDTSEYTLSVSDTSLTNMVEDTSKRTTVGNVTSLYYTLQTSTANIGVCILQNFFSLTLLNNTDNAAKVYRDGTQILPTSLSRIARGTPAVIIDARESATSDTRYNATLTSDTGVVITDNGHLGTIASMVKDHMVSVTTTQANCTVTTIMNGVSSSETVARTSSYSFNLTATTGSAMSGVLTMGGSQIQSWSGVTSIQYTIAHVTDNVTLTVTEVSSPKDWVRIDISDCPHGSIGVQDNTLVILKSGFTGFRITGIFADTNYEIVVATYEWLVGGTSVGGGTISAVPATITYSGTMPADSEVVCVVHVNFRHNALYLTRHESGSFVLRRPSSLWLNANGACTEIIGVVVQTQSHPAPEVLYGNLTLPSS